MKNRIIAIVAVLLLSFGAQAQYNETNNLFYHAFRTPQSNLLNPALFPTNNTFFLQLPSFGVHFGSPLSINNVARLDTSASGNVTTVIDINKMLTAITADNDFRMGTEFNIFGFGFKTGSNFFTANVRMMNNISVGLPISTINALLRGNVDGYGNPITEVDLVDGDLLNFTNYLEAGIGAGHIFDDLGLTVGGRAKLLYGVANLQTDNTRAVLITDDDFESVGVDIYYEIQGGSAVAVDSNGVRLTSVGEMLNIFKANTGLSFDIGARYDKGPFSFSASIIDLTGGIHWRRNTAVVTPDGGHTTVTFDGQEVTGMLNGGNLNSDSLTAYYQQVLNGLAPTTDGGEYWSSIPTKINLGASYNFGKMFRAGLLLHGQFDRGLLCKRNTYAVDLGNKIHNTFRFNTTLTVGVDLFNWAEVLVGSSVVYDGQHVDLFNPGIGLVLSPFKILQFHIMADYISSIYLADAKAFNVKFGLALLFGNGGKDKISQD
ncbi:MAG: hypothetical protein IKP21_08260 [Bacteroidales bacterium]|nr:hypothetical protein [Bacteroidales bacterium]